MGKVKVLFKACFWFNGGVTPVPLDDNVTEAELKEKYEAWKLGQIEDFLKRTSCEISVDYTQDIENYYSGRKWFKDTELELAKEFVVNKRKEDVL